MTFFRSCLLGLCFLSALPLLGACGSDVTGSGGAGGAAGAGGSAGAGPTGLEACNDACHKFDVGGCLMGMGVDCATLCGDYMAEVPTECDDEEAALWKCTEQGVPTCDNEPTACDALKQDEEKCVQTYGCSLDSTCFGGGGPNGETTCGCEAVCKNKKYATDCSTPAGGVTTCNCLVNDVSVGTCQATTDNSCGVKSDCCNTQFFKL